MNSMLLLEAIGQLDEDLLERSENASGKKNTVRRVIQWTALAACICIVFAWGSQFLSMGSKKADLSNGENGLMEENPQSVKPMDKPAESVTDAVLFDAFYTRMDGTAESIPQISVINSSDELNTYLETKDQTSTMEKYVAAFFAEKQLIVLNLEEKDKGTAPKIIDIVRDPQLETVVVNVRWEYTPQTEENAYWHICIEVPKGFAAPETVKLRHHVIVEEPAG